MRILHVLDHSLPLHSGYIFRTLSILREQRALGWETFQLTSPKQGQTGADEEDVDGWRFYRTPPPRPSPVGLPGFSEVRIMRALRTRLAQVAAELRPDILHAHSPVLNALPALSVARKLRIPLVYEVRAFWEDAAVDHGTSSEWGARYRLTRALETFALRRCDHVTTICEGLRTEMTARGIPGDKITVIPNAVDVSAFRPGGPPDEALKARLGLTRKYVIGFIGSFYAYEGLDLLLDALPRILSSRPDVCVLLVGGGPEETRLMDRARELGVSDVVVFAGRVPHDEVPKYYDLVDIFAYPRRSMRLTELVTPLKPLEAMAQDRLVLASNVGGHRELIRDGETGVLFEAGNVQALVGAVEKLLTNPAGWARLRHAARLFVESERNWTASVQCYKDVYERLV